MSVEVISYKDGSDSSRLEKLNSLEGVRFQKRNTKKAAEDGGVQEQSRGYRDDNYDTSGVHWGIAEGIMSNADARIVWEAIANIQKRGYNSYAKTVNGEHFVEANNMLMVVDTNYRNPVIRTIYKFNDTNESNMSLAKELLKDAEGIQSRLRDAWEIIGIYYGEGYVTRYDFADSEAYGRENARRERANSSSDTSGTEQQQRRIESLSDREILYKAAEGLNALELSEGEQSALDIFKKNLDELETLQMQREDLRRC